MNRNEKLITQFYTAFQNSDYKAMADCYHPDITFSDPVFPLLKGKEVTSMWAMLCQRKADPASRTFYKVHADENTGSAHWEAKYNFPLNGRFVHNVIEAAFTFKDGKIIRHIDSFDFYRWSRMAFGWKGLLLGWTPFFKNKVRVSVRGRLDQFRNTVIESEATYEKP
jgi:ketosteroid isomerase-like protein